jgi:DNA-binding protein YbaB
MFDKLKELNELRTLQNAIKKQRVETERDGVRIVMNGSMEIEHIHLNPSLPPEKLEKAVKDCFNTAVKELQQIIAKNIKM